MRKGPVTVLRYSCLTGRAVWLYYGPTKGAAASAYWRACQNEVKRFRRWKRTAARRRENIMGLLGECMGGRKLQDLPPEKRAAARELLAIAGETPQYDREFYDHLMEERRRRARDHKIRLAMREREENERRMKEESGQEPKEQGYEDSTEGS